MKKQFLNQHGMSLISALVALLILTFGLLSVAEVFLGAMRYNGSAGGVTELMNAAERTTEAVMLLPDTLAPVGAFTNASALNVAYNTALYDVKYKITNTPLFGGDTHTMRIEVVADYTPSYAKTMRVSLGDSEVRVVSYRYVR